ncbi:MAG: FAD-dependent oxidoreductase [Hyphomicrobiaceae bacterium]|nr:FAD-dependent oxidoreductase [Hyphomicrobiaceae bacterium]
MSQTDMQALPRQARAVIIGGGVAGCSVAYHLAKLGWTDVVLLERKQLTSGTTWHAAGLIAQLRATANMTKLAKYSQELYGRLEAETGVATGFKRNGSITLALTADRFEELQRGASMARAYGVEIETISAQEAATRHPLLEAKDAVGAVYLPKDGQGDPANITLAMAKGARNLGVKILEHVKVTGITTARGRVTGVTTEAGPIATEVVVNCAGMWARDVGAMAGVPLPLQACEHFYIVTEADAAIPRDLPVLRVPDECAYYKEDAGKILLGAFEPVAKPWALDGIPEAFCFDQLPEDFDHFAPILEKAASRVPLLGRVGIHTFFNGPESFTHDDRYLLGEAPHVQGFFVACGFNSVGIQSAGGAGMALAQWIVDKAPPFDLWDVDVRRVFPFQATRTFIQTRVRETLGLLYADHYPHRQYATSRGVRHTPFYEAFKARGACFGETAGWERAHWFLPPDALARGERPEYRYGWGREAWFAYAGAEHRAVRETVGALDMSAFGKFRVEGPDAEAVLQRICANDVAVPVGRIVYTQWLNERGGVEADLTVTRLGETSFLVVTSAACAVRDLAWLQRHAPEGARCVVLDVTSGEACLAVMGPSSRALLEMLTRADLSNAAFPFGTARTIELGMALVRAHRVTYVGELGWELYVPTEFARHLLEVVLEAGERLGLRLAGVHAMDSLRLEKGYRHFGHDVCDEDHVIEAGLGFAVKTDKPRSALGDFIGREAVLRTRAQGPSRRLLQFRLKDPGPLLFHGEPIVMEGAIAGYLTSGGYGHTLGGAVGMGYVPCAPKSSLSDLLARRFEIEIAGRRVPAEASAKPLYDPEGRRIRG